MIFAQCLDVKGARSRRALLGGTAQPVRVLAPWLRRMALFCSLALLPFGTAAMAQDKPDDRVNLIVAPYGWAPTLTGTTGLGPLSVPVKVTPKDFLAGFKIGFLGSFRAEKGRRFAFVDAIVVNYDNSAFAPFFGQHVTSKVRFFQAGTGIDLPIRISGRSGSISPFAGIQSLSITSNVSGNLITTTADGAWTNPAVGVQFRFPLAKRLQFTGMAEAAGFGLGQVDYRSASANLDYQVSNHVGIYLGYRLATGQYRANQGLSLDLHASGPVVGLRYAIPIGGRAESP